MTETPSLRSDLARRLAILQAGSAEDPFTNAASRFAASLSDEMQADAVTLDALDELVRELSAEAFEARAERLRDYLGEVAPEPLEARLVTLFEGVAATGDFDSYARRLAEIPFGVVLTAHPTFALNHDLSMALVEIATGRDRTGQPLAPDAVEARRALALSHDHAPPGDLTLDIEHAWSVEALANAHAALRIVYGAALDVARRRWPSRWTALQPRLMSLATWVGFDQDGRTDVTWQVSVAKRLELKIAALEERRGALVALAEGAQGEWLEALGQALHLLGHGADTAKRQLETLQAALASPEALPAFARAMVDGRRAALVDPSSLLRRLDDALDAAPDDACRRELLILRAGLATEGVSLARIHVRLNAGQLHNAVRRDVGLESSPTDPANRRTYFAAIDGLIARAEAVEISFGDLDGEPASARRLFMTLAQMRKYVDGSTLVRFLIAETEAGFTLLVALYFARLFGVEDHVEISPLFETQEALDRGEKVLEEALRSAHFRDYLRRQGKLAIEFGFSDSGRFIGQPAATFRIERLRFRLAELLQAHGLGGLEVIFFNTHGESVGRGGHPGSLADRFRYAAPPRSRLEFAKLGARVKEEDAFQGGEGYLPLLTRPAALATVTAALESVLAPDPEAIGDPIYDEADFASEFFATCEQSFADLVADKDYAALVGVFATHLLPKTGSRPVQRQAGDGGRPRTLASVRELRAIPNNGVLQQLGYFANSLYGVGRAAEKDCSTFDDMRRRSPRFRRAMALVEAAAAHSDFTVLQAYASTVDPALWLARAAAGDDPFEDLAVADVAERAELSEALARVGRKLRAEDVRLQAAGLETGMGERLLLLHAIRLALIQRVDRLLVAVPDFNPRGDVTAASIQERLLRLDIPSALDQLESYFPLRPELAREADFGETSTYSAAQAQGYRMEHETLFQPLRRLYGLMLAVTAAVIHEVGACG